MDVLIVMKYIHGPILLGPEIYLCVFKSWQVTLPTVYHLRIQSTHALKSIMVTSCCSTKPKDLNELPVLSATKTGESQRYFTRG